MRCMRTVWADTNSLYRAQPFVVNTPAYGCRRLRIPYKNVYSKRYPFTRHGLGAKPLGHKSATLH